MNNYFNYDDGINNFNQIFLKNNYDNSLSNKLKKQGGDNMNYNLAGFSGDADYDKLYDVYNGFIRGNMFPNLFNQYKLSMPYDIKPMNDQAELLTKVDAYCFACHDLNLYLDTHPDDRNMVNLFKELSEDSKMAVSEYENKYGPLFVDSSISFPWAWNESPWPWDN